MERWFCEDSQNSNEIFIDCDYKIFIHVLNFITIHGYIVPDKYVHNVQKLLDYYSPNKFTIVIPQKSGLIILEFGSKRSSISYHLKHNGIVSFYVRLYWLIIIFLNLY